MSCFSATTASKLKVATSLYTRHRWISSSALSRVPLYPQVWQYTIDASGPTDIDIEGRLSVPRLCRTRANRHEMFTLSGPAEDRFARYPGIFAKIFSKFCWYIKFNQTNKERPYRPPLVLTETAYASVRLRLLIEVVRYRPHQRSFRTHIRLAPGSNVLVREENLEPIVQLR